MISFDKDIDSSCRKNQAKFYGESVFYFFIFFVVRLANLTHHPFESGYIPDDHNKRGICFLLLTLISSTHNLSMSIGCALLLATGGKSLMLSFVCGGILLYLVFKIVMGDFLIWMRLEGVLGFFASLLVRVFVKIIVDFTGCIHFRHPYEMGGVAYSMSTVWVSPNKGYVVKQKHKRSHTCTHTKTTHKHKHNFRHKSCPLWLFICIMIRTIT